MNNEIDHNNIYMNKGLKIILNIIFYYIFLNYLFMNNLSMSKNILVIITFSVVIMYLLDSNFPSCYL
jgi:hypothetical protein